VGLVRFVDHSNRVSYSGLPIYQDRALENYRAEIFDKYLNQIEELDSDANRQASDIMRIRTLNILRELDGRRKGQVIQLLLEKNLLQNKDDISLEKPAIDLTAHWGESDRDQFEQGGPFRD
jgi:hypothetical protein